jgi:EmrB/QacA subfamily drug resistance transporter
VILESTSWRWIFYVNVPIGAIAVVAALRVIPSATTGAARPLDFRGLGLMVTGLPLLAYGLAEIGTTGGFSSLTVIIPCFAGLALIALFTLHARHAAQPLLNLRLHRRRTFSSAAVAMFLLGAALFGGMILMPLYWQEVRHESVIATGLLVGPQGLGLALVMPLAGRLADRLGGGPPALFGIVLTTVATIPFGLVGAHTSTVWLCAALFVRGMGIGLAFMPAMTAAFAALERSELADATPQLNVLQRVGGSLGTAVLAVVLQRALAGAHTLAGAASAYGTAFWAAAALTAVALVPAAILLRAERAARAERAPEALPGTEQALETAAA